MRFFLTALSPAILLAQNAQVTGRVADPSGAVIPGAAVTVVGRNGDAMLVASSSGEASIEKESAGRIWVRTE